MRVAFVIGMIGLAQAAPAMALPNAFWIFGFHVPGKQGAKSDVVMVKPGDQQIAALLPVKAMSNDVRPVPDATPIVPAALDAKPVAAF